MKPRSHSKRLETVPTTHQIGVASCCITPEESVDLCGYIARRQPLLGKSDDLYAKALFLADNKRPVLWIIADVIGFSDSFAALLTARLKRLAEDTRLCILISASHTHSGPATMRLRGCGRPNFRYLRGLARKLVAVGLDAIRVQTPATGYFAQCSSVIGRDRLTGLKLTQALPVLGFRGTDGKWMAILTCLGVHNVGFSHKNRKISADIAGFSARTLQGLLEGSPVALIASGACGNINPIYSGNVKAEVCKVGESLARAIKRALAKARPLQTHFLSCTNKLAPLPLEQLSRAEVESEYEEDLATIRPESLYLDRWNTDIRNRIYSALKAWKTEASHRSLSKRDSWGHLNLQLLSIGEIRFVAVGAEVPEQFEKELQREFPFPVYVVGYTGGDAGYVMPHAAGNAGKYELRFAHKFHGTWRFKADAYKHLSDGAKQLLSQSRA